MIFIPGSIACPDSVAFIGNAAVGRWLGVDPQGQFASPYLAMEGRTLIISPVERFSEEPGCRGGPVMYVDPDGEFVQFSVPMIIAAYANVVAQGMSGNIDNAGQLFGAFAKGASTSALSAGAGMGFSAGLNAMGVGVQASNFIGGALGSFSGNILMGGMPTSSFGWASAIGNAALMGSIQAKANPLGLSQGYDATAVDYGMLNLGGGVVELAPQTIKALNGFGTAD